MQLSRQAAQCLQQISISQALQIHVNCACYSSAVQCRVMPHLCYKHLPRLGLEGIVVGVCSTASQHETCVKTT